MFIIFCHILFNLQPHQNFQIQTLSFQAAIALLDKAQPS